MMPILQVAVAGAAKAFEGKPANTAGSACQAFNPGKAGGVDFTEEAMKVAVSVFTGVAQEALGGMEISPVWAKVGAKVACIWATAAVGAAAAVLCPPAAPMVAGGCFSALNLILLA